MLRSHRPHESRETYGAERECFIAVLDALTQAHATAVAATTRISEEEKTK